MSAAVAAGARAARRRPSLLPGGAIIAAVVAAWTLAIAVDLSGHAGALHHHGLSGQSLAVGPVALLLAAWVAMIVAMMLPTTLPLMRLFARTAATQPHPGGAYAAFLAGYVGVWTVFGIAALASDAALHGAVERIDWLDKHAPLIAASILIAAGAFQFSPLKQRCLTECRHPASYLLRYYRRGWPAALRMGGGHGIFCLGCCWALMLVMFAAGTADLVWMALLTILMVVEKTVRGGARIVKPAGALLIGLGLLLLINPGWLPDALGSGFDRDAGQAATLTPHRH